ncbi:endonuclease 8-like 2 [Phalacrocorax aristotelis]|uniref:endonuclease 8-like 2 n=1 Tax=Phalacrocorax aristotelis TaxID=126867 RepID=UPI003F4B91FC
MPEGPSVRKFQLLTSPFVGQVVAKVGGSSRKINVNDLNALRLHDSQVHGKNLYLAFVAADSPLGPTAEETVLQGEAASGASSPAQGGQEQVCGPQARPQEEELQGLLRSRSEAPDAAEGPGSWLRFHFGLFGSIRANEFSRANKANKRGDWKDPIPRLVLHFESGGFLVFYNCRIHWCSSPRADPASDILSVEFHRGRALDALRTPDPICHTLLNQKYFSGLGNIIKNEILYLAKIHPLTQGSVLALPDLERLLDCAVQFSAAWLHIKLRGKGLHPQIYQKEHCPLGHAVMKGTLGASGGFKRLTWWCPQCQPVVPSGDGDPAPATE